MTVVTAASDPSEWTGRPTDWFNIDDPGLSKYNLAVHHLTVKGSGVTRF